MIVGPVTVFVDGFNFPTLYMLVLFVLLKIFPLVPSKRTKLL